MKLIKTIFLTGALTAALSLVSCAEWLDVNTDPENPTLESAEYQLELAHCEFYTNSAQQFAAWRSSMAIGLETSVVVPIGVCPSGHRLTV